MTPPDPTPSRPPSTQKNAESTPSADPTAGRPTAQTPASNRPPEHRTLGQGTPHQGTLSSGVTGGPPTRPNRAAVRGSPEGDLFEEVHRLITARLENTITAVELALLEELVLHNPQARRLYVHYVLDSVALFWSLADRSADVPRAAALIQAKPRKHAVFEWSIVGQEESSPKVQLSSAGAWLRQTRKRNPGLWALAVASVVLLVVVGLLSWNSEPQKTTAQRPTQPSGEKLGRLTAAHHARWTLDGRVWSPRIDSALLRGSYKLSRGYAQLTLQNGPVLIVSAPAEFRLDRNETLQLNSGQLTARVPPKETRRPSNAVLRVLTPAAEAVDLGTEFGVRVSSAHMTEVHVFQGEVLVTPISGSSGHNSPTAGPGQATTRVQENQAVAVDTNKTTSQQLQSLPLDRLGFLRRFPSPGLLGEYFNNEDLTDLASRRVDPQIDFSEDDWGDSPPGTNLDPDDEFSVRWTGFVRIDHPGVWKFHTFSNDGVRLWVADRQVIDNWMLLKDVRSSGQLELAAGWHPLRLEYFQHQLTVAIKLSFAGPEQPEVLIPGDYLSTLDPTATVER